MGDKSIPNRGWSGTGRKKNVNGKQILTENKLKSKNEPKDKLKTVRLSKGGKVKWKILRIS